MKDCSGCPIFENFQEVMCGYHDSGSRFVGSVAVTLTGAEDADTEGIFDQKGKIDETKLVDSLSDFPQVARIYNEAVSQLSDAIRELTETLSQVQSRCRGPLRYKQFLLFGQETIRCSYR